MAVKKAVKEFCAHNLVCMIVTDMQKRYFSDTDTNELLSDFSSSETYNLLFDMKTGLWSEGSDYVMNMYFEEKGIKPVGRN